MIKIRRNVFETNSSSTHSICVTKSNILDQLQNYIEFTIGEFGWEHDKHSSPHTKASYLYTAILELKRDELIENIKTILEANEIDYGFEVPVYSEWGGLKDGYIDHSEDLIDFLKICEDEDKLMKYLFSSESFIITGNDNDDGDVDINVSYKHTEYYKGN